MEVSLSNLRLVAGLCARAAGPSVLNGCAITFSGVSHPFVHLSKNQPTRLTDGCAVGLVTRPIVSLPKPRRIFSDIVSS
jgi:hypothetical protein